MKVGVVNCVQFTDEKVDDDLNEGKMSIWKICHADFLNFLAGLLE